MLQLILDGSFWYGLDKNTATVAISHAKLLEWAKEHGCYDAISCSTAIRLHDGTRLVRGAKMVQDAEKEGWSDLANGLIAEVEGNVKEGLL